MIEELTSHRFLCDWESDNAGCGINIDVLNVESFGDAVLEMAAKGWVFWPPSLPTDTRLGWVFCPDCKHSGMAREIYAELEAVL